jgi:large subunit ribosomal protein L15
MRLNQISDFKSAQKKPKRVGRGVGSGLGKTCGVGQKGQKARTGVAIKGFEGGQMPLHRRLPKRGFVSHVDNDISVVNLKDLQDLKEANLLNDEILDITSFVKLGLVRKSAKKVKVLGSGDLSFSLKIKVNKASTSAAEKIKNSGGELIIID